MKMSLLSQEEWGEMGDGGLGTDLWCPLYQWGGICHNVFSGFTSQRTPFHAFLGAQKDTAVLAPTCIHQGTTVQRMFCELDN